MRIDPDDVYENEYAVTNNYNLPVTVEIMLGEWNTYAGNAGLKVEDWLSVEPKQIKLKAGETGYVKYKVQTSTAMVGSLAASVMFTVRPPHQEMFKVRFTTFFYAHIRGTEKVDFEVLGARFEWFGDFILGYINIKNNGNTHIRPRGTYVLKGPKIKKYTGNLLLNVPVYAESSRSDFEMRIPKGLDMAPGKYTIDLNVTALGKTAKKTVRFRINKDGSITNLK